MQIRKFVFEQGVLREVSEFSDERVCRAAERGAPEFRERVIEAPFLLVGMLVIIFALLGTLAAAKDNTVGLSDPAPVFLTAKQEEDVGGSLSTSLVTYSAAPVEPETPAEPEAQAEPEAPMEPEAPAEPKPEEAAEEAPALGKFYEVPAAETGAKTYMDYRTITSKSSKQWALQQDEHTWTDENGFRRYGDYYMVAMGTYYGYCGDTFRITLKNGFSFDVIMGDVKSDAHTDEKHQHRFGNVVEFIVDTDAIKSDKARQGNMSFAFEEMNSKIATIQAIP